MVPFSGDRRAREHSQGSSNDIALVARDTQIVPITSPSLHLRITAAPLTGAAP